MHGTQLLELNHDTPDHVVADGVYTDKPGLACTVMVADCLPVLLTEVRGTRVAAVHAGWRGLAGADGVGILEQTLKEILPLALVDTGSNATEFIAWLGPCIGPSVFEVGSEVVDAFIQTNPQALVCFTPHGAGKWLADLPGLARQRLAALGVSRVFGNDGSAPWCTVRNSLRFFSYRRDRFCGRLAACIWLD